MTRSAPPRTYTPQTQVRPGGDTDAALRVEREDLITFVNAAFSCTGQREFYGDAAGQSVSIEFLHEYICGNYRGLYARALAVGINHFNAAKVIVNLLASSREAGSEAWHEEGRLCMEALRRLPAPQAYRLIGALAQRRVNNRRTRAIVRDWLASRDDLYFDAVKYRSRLRAAVRHCHLRLPEPLGRFLFGGSVGAQRTSYEHPLLDAYRRAHYEKRAIYELPYTVAEGFAAKHGVDRGEFLERIEPMMTRRERMRLMASAAEQGVEVEVELGSMPLTRLCSWVVTRSFEERARRLEELHAILCTAAAKVVARLQWRLGSVVAVLDSSYSSSGSREKRRRPLAIALAAHYLLAAASTSYEGLWTSPPPAGESPCDRSLLVSPRGPTDLASPILRALQRGPDVVVVVSDGYDNDPPGAAGEVLRVFRERFDPTGNSVSIVHANPVFDADDFSPRALTPSVPTIGLRDAEDLPTMLAFARFATSDAGMSELASFLSRRASTFAPAKEPLS